jgi:hypothetical protein
MATEGVVPLRRKKSGSSPPKRSANARILRLAKAEHDEVEIVTAQALTCCHGSRCVGNTCQYARAQLGT